MKSNKGEVSGVTLQTDYDYVKNNFGEKKIKEIEEKLKNWGFPIKYTDISSEQWLPVALRALSLIAIKDVLNFRAKDIKKMGNESPKYSLIVKLIMKFFTNKEKVFKKAPEMWRRHYTIGELKLINFDKNHLAFKIINYDLHPIMCIYYEGYFQRIAEYIIPGAICKEVKYLYKKNINYHEYQIDWKK